jgi:hypothetical protein
MSLLARENRRQKQRLREQEDNHARQLREQEEKIQNLEILFHVPPVDIYPPIQSLEQGEPWLSEPFYSHIGGYKLQLEVHLIRRTDYRHCTYKYRYNLLDSEFTVPPFATLHITTKIKLKHRNTVTRKDRVVCGKTGTFIEQTSQSVLLRPGSITFHISQIEIET